MTINLKISKKTQVKKKQKNILFKYDLIKFKNKIFTIFYNIKKTLYTGFSLKNIFSKNCRYNINDLHV